MKIEVRLRNTPLQLETPRHSTNGAVARFEGIVRETEDRRPIAGLHYEAYDAMALKTMRSILEELGAETPFHSAMVQHRLGLVPVGEAAIVLEVHAERRKNAFAVLTAFMDRLKEEVPIWKSGVEPVAVPDSSSAEERKADTEIEQLWEWIDARVPVLPAQIQPLSETIGRINAEPVCATVDQPAHDQSAMDGYAFAEIDPGKCRIMGTVAAGWAGESMVQPGGAVRIFTGSRLPEGTRCVGRQEDCLADGEFVSLRPGKRLVEEENIRRAGAVFSKGARILERGMKLSAGAAGLLASAGVAAVNVHPAARTLHVATGEELCDVEAGPLATGKIYDSNGPMMEALLRQYGVVPERRRLGDSPTEIGQVVAGFDGDLLLISGGSGPGDHDHTPAALRNAGYEIHASRINSRPGRPLIFATRGGQVAFGLPGNPLSHWVCFHAFVRRALARLHGEPKPDLWEAKLLGPWPGGGDGRRTWTPAIVAPESIGLAARPLPWQHSGDLTPMTSANALILDTPDPATGRVKLFWL